MILFGVRLVAHNLRCSSKTLNTTPTNIKYLNSGNESLLNFRLHVVYNYAGDRFEFVGGQICGNATFK